MAYIVWPKRRNFQKTATVTAAKRRQGAARFTPLSYGT
jgi:hypothetical protein